MSLGGNLVVCLSLNLLLRDFKFHLEEVFIERPEFVFQKKEDETLEILCYTGSRRVFELVKEFYFQDF